MRPRIQPKRSWIIAGGACVLLGVALAALAPVRSAEAGWLWGRHNHACPDCQPYFLGPGDVCNTDQGGTWYWVRSPEEEQRVVMGLFNRYCIRCHGVDGRGVWDIPDVPDFTDMRWQVSRPDAYRARIIMEGRGAVMPPFRGTLTLEEAWGLARYLHAFVPGTEVSRPDMRTPAAAPGAPAPAPAPPPAPAPAPPATTAPAPFAR